MLKEQNELIAQAKKRFPHYSLKVWSEKTGVQITRIFRLFKGNEMMLSEYLAFQDFLASTGQSDFLKSRNNLLEKSKLCLEHLSPNLIEEINSLLSYQLENHFVFNGQKQ